MKLSTAEKKLLQAFGSLAQKLAGFSPVPDRKARAGHRRRRTMRSREESARMKKAILAAVRKGIPIREVAEKNRVTAPYVYQLVAKAKGRS